MRAALISLLLILAAPAAATPPAGGGPGTAAADCPDPADRAPRGLILRSSLGPAVWLGEVGADSRPGLAFTFAAGWELWDFLAVEAAYRALKSKGKLEGEIEFVAFAGDGGTYDIGLQSLSGALERGHDFLYVCLNNEAYMNTGIQRSSATPKGASATTTPAGKESYGEKQWRKNLTEIVAAHEVPYVAQASISNLTDLSNKVEKAVSYQGPTFLNVLATCQLGWRINPRDAVDTARIGVDTCYWPLYEVEEGEYTVNYEPKEKKPVEEWLKPQKRFSHLFKTEYEEVVEQIQGLVDRDWERLHKKADL